jgi:2-aminoadipate transaminase
MATTATDPGVSGPDAGPPERAEEGWGRAFARRTHAGGGGDITAILALAEATEVITFSGGFPAPETFPNQELPALLDRLLGSSSAPLQYGPTPGLEGFRDALSDRLERTEGRRPAESELLVTSGGIDALTLIGRAMLDQGDLVAVEAPTYLGALSAFGSYEAETLEVPLDADGLDVDAFGEALGRGARPKLVYVIPDHQNPTGQTLSADRRAALVALCRRHGVLIVEDVAYRDLGATPERPPSLWTLGPDITVQIGTFSKIFFPGIRLGWAAGPAPVVAEMTRAKQTSDQCAGSLGQCLAEAYLRSGGLDAQLPRSRALYDERRRAMLAALEAHLPPGFTWTRPAGGFFVWVSGPAGLDTVGLAPRAEAAGVAYVPGAPFYAASGQGAHEMRLAYSRATPTQITEGIRRLGDLLVPASEGR